MSESQSSQASKPTSALNTQKQKPKDTQKPKAGIIDKDGDGLDLDDIVGRLDAFQLLRKTEGNDADDVLNELGANSKVDREIVLQLGARRPLGHPRRFEEAHTLAIRSLEVLDRNGHQDVPVPSLGPLTPIVRFLVQIVTQFIVRSHVSNVIDSMLRLYERREAAALVNYEHLPMLIRARIHTQRVRQGFRRNALALPTFLFGGAVLSPIVGLIQTTVLTQISSKLWRTVILGVLFLILSGASWTIVQGAAVARRRIRLTTERPLRSLWQIIGRCGEPPKDHSTTFAAIALVLTLISILIVGLTLVNLVL